MKPLPSRQFTEEDVAVFARLLVRIMRRKPGAAIKWLRATAESDRRDASLMLVAVRHPQLAVLKNTDTGLRIDIRKSCGMSIERLGLYVSRDDGII